MKQYNLNEGPLCFVFYQPYFSLYFADLIARQNITLHRSHEKPLRNFYPKLFHVFKPIRSGGDFKDRLTIAISSVILVATFFLSVKVNY